MSINVFEKLLIEKIEIFKSAFAETAESVFFNDDGKLIHPGEFGRYRENICKQFLKFVTPASLDIGTGFIINTSNKVSHQCDIIIYDVQHTPLLESEEKQFFFPVETIAAVGEIKSVLSKKALSEAIQKLARVKVLREEVKNPAIIKKDRGTGYDPSNHIYDQIFTFIVCKKLSFNISNLSTEINKLYGDSTEYRHRHNLILSVEDGLLAYYDNNGKTMMYPVMGNTKLKNRFVAPGENPYVHLKYFASYLFMGTSSATILYPEISDYMGSITGGYNYDEKCEDTEA